MKWLKISEIKRRSKTAKGALKVSYEHWNQLYQATAKELRKEYEKTDGDISDADYCGLCKCREYIHGLCQSCIFDKYCPHGIWKDAHLALKYWINGDGDWRTWKRTSKAVRNKLKELMQSKEAK